MIRAFSFFCISVFFAMPLFAEIIRIDLSGEVQGTIDIKLYTETAPKHSVQIKELVMSGAYDGVAFHRVIEGFMAQTGDVLYGNVAKNHFFPSKVGMGGSSMPDLNAEFNEALFKRGTVGMARSQDPNSANSQFFIMFADASHLNGQYTVIGEVLSGMDVVDKIKRGPSNGIVPGIPDYIRTIKLLN